MARITDADAARVAKERGDLPEEIGFCSQDGLFFRRLDDGSVRVSVVEYLPVRGVVGLDQVRATARRLVFSTVLPPSVWGSIVANAGILEETGETLERAIEFHMGPKESV